MASFTEFTTFSNVDWTSAADATGLRAGGDLTSSITLSGVSGSIADAYLYWNGLSGANGYVTNQQVSFAGNAITGDLVSVGGDTCWGGGASYTYRADVTQYVSGNGTYNVTDLGSGSNGATLVVIYDDGNAANNRNLSIYNGAFSTPFDASTFTLQLNPFTYWWRCNCHAGRGRRAASP